ncbi:DCC1-like thiol-disulfide oxidoreductase family protein [Hydrogenophaga crassostreae]|nr:DCC1-like thiol-disulfide oxidoreductase family protein [Hydrogenophaga crassostreae]
MSAIVRRFEPRAFPVGSAFEHNKFALLRIVFGLVLLMRELNVYSLLLNSERLSPVGLWSGAAVLTSALLTVGFASQWALLFLIGAMWQHGEVVVGTSTLGTDVGAILAVLLFLVNAGKHLSIDAILLKRRPAFHIAGLYYKGVPNADAVFYAKFTALASYWAVCVYSVVIHLNEPAWMDGSAGPLLLSNNFMATWHEQFSALFTFSENAVALAKGSLWLMMLWYPAVLPFVLLGGWFRRYVIIWGVLFFALSLFGLQLGWLAEIEIVLWLALFWSFAGTDQSHTLEVLYDDRCNLCDKTVQVITLFDVFGRIYLKPLSKNRALLDELGLDMSEALTDLYGVRTQDRALFRGYDFYFELTRTLILLWPLLPFLWLGRVLWVGPQIYRFVALRRTRLFGVCELPRQKFSHPQSELSTSRFPQVVALQVCALLLFYFAAIPAPHLGWNGISNLGARAAQIYGITPIDVFNKTDLRMAENWFVLDSIDFEERVPVFESDGSRLSMHASDRIYFGHTLRFRRQVIGDEVCQFQAWQPMLQYLSRVYLQQRSAAPGEYHFSYTQFHQPLVNAKDIAQNQFKQVSSRSLCELDYSVAYLK